MSNQETKWNTTQFKCMHIVLRCQTNIWLNNAIYHINFKFEYEVSKYIKNEDRLGIFSKEM